MIKVASKDLRNTQQTLFLISNKTCFPFVLIRYVKWLSLLSNF